MEKKKLPYLILCLLVAGFPFFISPVFGQTKPIELNYSIFFPAPHKMGALAGEWAKEIEKRTDGRVKINLFYGGTLTPPGKCYEGVVSGTSDIGISVFGYTRGRFPLTEVSDLPLGFKNGYVATKVLNEYYRKFQPKELDDVKVLYLHSHGPSILHTRKPVTKLEELKGLKIRSGGLIAKVVAALGATPVALPITEAYDALSKGVAEGIMVTPEALEGFRIGEVVKFTTENFGSACGGGQFVVMNKEKWNALAPDIKNTIEKINEEWIEKTGKLWIEMEKSGIDFSIKRGNKVISLTKKEDERWAKAVKPVIDDYIKDTKAKGLPGEEVIKFYRDYLKKHQ